MGRFAAALARRRSSSMGGGLQKQATGITPAARWQECKAFLADLDLYGYTPTLTQQPFRTWVSLFVTILGISTFLTLMVLTSFLWANTDYQVTEGQTAHGFDYHLAPEDATQYRPTTMQPLPPVIAWAFMPASAIPDMSVIKYAATQRVICGGPSGGGGLQVVEDLKFTTQPVYNQDGLLYMPAMQVLDIEGSFKSAIATNKLVRNPCNSSLVVGPNKTYAIPRVAGIFGQQEYAFLQLDTFVDLSRVSFNSTIYNAVLQGESRFAIHSRYTTTNSLASGKFPDQHFILFNRRVNLLQPPYTLKWEVSLAIRRLSASSFFWDIDILDDQGLDFQPKEFEALSFFQNFTNFTDGRPNWYRVCRTYIKLDDRDLVVTLSATSTFLSLLSDWGGYISLVSIACYPALLFNKWLFDRTVQKLVGQGRIKMDEAARRMMCAGRVRDAASQWTHGGLHRGATIDKVRRLRQLIDRLPSKAPQLRDIKVPLLQHDGTIKPVRLGEVASSMDANVVLPADSHTAQPCSHGHTSTDREHTPPSNTSHKMLAAQTLMATQHSLLAAGAAGASQGPSQKSLMVQPSMARCGSSMDSAMQSAVSHKRLSSLVSMVSAASGILSLRNPKSLQQQAGQQPQQPSAPTSQQHQGEEDQQQQNPSYNDPASPEPLPSAGPGPIAEGLEAAASLSGGLEATPEEEPEEPAVANKPARASGEGLGHSSSRGRPATQGATPADGTDGGASIGAAAMAWLGHMRRTGSGSTRSPNPRLQSVFSHAVPSAPDSGSSFAIGGQAGSSTSAASPALSNMTTATGNRPASGLLASAASAFTARVNSPTQSQGQTAAAGRLRSSRWKLARKHLGPSSMSASGVNTPPPAPAFMHQVRMAALEQLRTLEMELATASPTEALTRRRSNIGGSVTRSDLPFTSSQRTGAGAGAGSMGFGLNSALGADAYNRRSAQPAPWPQPPGMHSAAENAAPMSSSHAMHGSGMYGAGGNGLPTAFGRVSAPGYSHQMSEPEPAGMQRYPAITGPNAPASFGSFGRADSLPAAQNSAGAAGADGSADAAEGGGARTFDRLPTLGNAPTIPDATSITAANTDNGAGMPRHSSAPVPLLGEEQVAPAPPPEAPQPDASAAPPAQLPMPPVPPPFPPHHTQLPPPFQQFPHQHSMPPSGYPSHPNPPLFPHLASMPNPGYHPNYPYHHLPPQPSAPEPLPPGYPGGPPRESGGAGSFDAPAPPSLTATNSRGIHPAWSMRLPASMGDDLMQQDPGHGSMHGPVVYQTLDEAPYEGDEEDEGGMQTGNEGGEQCLDDEEEAALRELHSTIRSLFIDCNLDVFDRQPYETGPPCTFEDVARHCTTGCEAMFFLQQAVALVHEEHPHLSSSGLHNRLLVAFHDDLPMTPPDGPSGRSSGLGRASGVGGRSSIIQRLLTASKAAAKPGRSDAEAAANV